MNSTPTTDTQRLRKLLAAATPGPWSTYDAYHIGSNNIRLFHTSYYIGSIGNSDATKVQNEMDAELIAALRNAAPALLDEVESLRVRDKINEKQLDDLQNALNNLLAERDKLCEESASLRSKLYIEAENLTATLRELNASRKEVERLRSANEGLSDERRIFQASLASIRKAASANPIAGTPMICAIIVDAIAERDSLRRENEELHGQLARRSDTPAGGDVCQASNWINPSDNLPPRLLSVLVAGVLDGESQEAIHEAFHDGKRWRSVRGNGCDAWERFDSVRLWREMPKVDA